MIRYDFEGRVALITGGTSGIGGATALAFAQAGARVVVSSRSAEAGRATCEALDQSGSRALFVQADVRDEGSVAALVQQCIARFGRLDCAVNCAGAGGDMQPVERADQRVWDDVLATSLRGVWLSMRYELPALLSSGGGAIVNLGSTYSTAGRAAHHAYVAAKHGVLGLTRSVALEYASRNVRINALCPGVTRTASMIAAEVVVPELVQAVVEEHPIGRMAEEHEVAAAALWLCSDASRYVTGAPLFVDGGFSAS
jgi:A-factor type gamma-butyrolactone 1'-reductase (1S-forming)